MKQLGHRVGIANQVLPTCAKDSVQGGSQSHPCDCTLDVGRGQRHITDAVPDHCSLQARLWMYCVWHCIPYQFTTTWQHPQRWTKTGTRSILHQPSLQYVHGGQRSSSGRTSVEAVHELLYENSYLHWQPSTSCPTLIWPDHKRSVSFLTKWKWWHDSNPTQPIGLKVEEALNAAEIDK